jgi:hypothetical protein
MARRLAAAFLIGVMCVGGAASASVVYRCPMEEGTQRRCCCPPQQTDVETPTIARGCCQAEDVQPAAPAPSESPRAALQPLAPPPVRAASSTAPTLAILPLALVTPPRRGPPPLEQKQSRLI